MQDFILILILQNEDISNHGGESGEPGNSGKGSACVQGPRGPAGPPGIEVGSRLFLKTSLLFQH